MKSIAEIDKRLAVETKVEREGLCFFDAEDAPFKVYGVFREGEKFRRIPEALAKEVNEGVYGLHANTAGGRVRFVTDSPYVVIKAKIRPSKMPHFAFSGSCGFDMFSEYDGDVRYGGTFMPPIDIEDWYESVQDHVNGSQERVVTINFPLYSDVYKLYIGLKEGSVLEEAPAYKVEKPVVSYGSSITQGGCASKPGSSYQSILSRKFNTDYINLGFSGSGRAEDNIVNYIKNLEMSVFIMDYDHNAPTPEYLESTHNKMFKAIREAQPNLPIIIMPRPKYYLNRDDQRRHEIIYATYQEALAGGDQNVYFISGHDLMAIVEDNGTVDNCHPTDSGFFSMAKAIEPVLGEILAKL